MAKAILEFDLSDPDDKQSFLRSSKSLDILIALWEIDQYIRSQVKYNEELTQEASDVLEKTREELYQILNNRNISFDELLT